MIGKILGHAHAQVTKRYAHLTDEALRGAVEPIRRRHNENRWCVTGNNAEPRGMNESVFGHEKIRYIIDPDQLNGETTPLRSARVSGFHLPLARGAYPAREERLQYLRCTMKTWSVLVFLASMLCISLLSAASGPSDRGAPDLAGVDPTPGAPGEIVFGPDMPVNGANSATAAVADALESDSDLALAEAAVADALESDSDLALAESAMTPTPWGAPVQVSPNNAVQLYHYPRATTLAWRPVTGAISYLVEHGYYDGTWHNYSPVTVRGANNASYTLRFVGDQKGHWRVKAYNGRVYSTVSPWWTFSYTTKAQMATPVLTSPAVDEVFYHYPRTTTLAWKMIPAAVGYKVETMYCLADEITCWPFATVTISDPLKSYHTFIFVGMQPGKWRVTALGAPDYLDSAPSAWRWFSYDI